MEHYRYILKVAEELLYNACPPELIQKYEMLKQISLSKASNLHLSNGDLIINQNQTQPISSFPSPSSSNNDKMGLQLFESMMECVGLFLDIIHSMNHSGTHQSKDFSNKIGEFNEITSKIIITQQQKQINEPQIKKNIYSFDKITQNMVRALYDLDNQIIINQKQFNQQNDQIYNLQQQIKKVNIEYEIQTQRSLQKQQLENIELLEKGKNLQTENDSLQMQFNEKKKQCDRYELQIESQNMKIIEIQNISDQQRIRLLNLEKEVQDKQKFNANQISLDLHHQKVDEYMYQINNLTKNSSELNHFYKTFKDEFNIYINKYQEAYDEYQKKSNQAIISDERLNLLLFIAYLFQKFEGDNMWLVERLTDFGKENDQLKQQIDKLKQQNEEVQTKMHYLKDQLKNSNILDNLSVQLQREIELSSQQINLYNDSKHKLKQYTKRKGSRGIFEQRYIS